MPTYDYECDACGTFEAVKRIADRDQPAACPACRQPAPRVLSAGSRVALFDRGGSGRSSDNGAYVRMRHAGGCSCC